MASLIDRYVADLYSYAVEQNVLEEYYACAFSRTHDEETLVRAPAELESFLKLVPETDVNAVLGKFISISRAKLGLLDVTVYSAVVLTEAQKAAVKAKLHDMFGKNVSMVCEVDTSLIGGLRIIVGHTVIDNTVKTKLAEMKKSVYKVVYSKQ